MAQLTDDRTKPHIFLAEYQLLKKAAGDLERGGGAHAPAPAPVLTIFSTMFTFN